MKEPKLPKNWGKLKNENLIWIQQTAYKIYLQDMKHLHPKIKPVKFDVFIEHCKRGI